MAVKEVISSIVRSPARRPRRVRRLGQPPHEVHFARAFSNAAGHEQRDTHFGFQQVPEQAKKNMVRDVFSSVAKNYDVMNDLMSGGLHRVWKDDFVKSMGLKTMCDVGDQPPRVLDVAGGTGDIAFRIMEELGPYVAKERSSNDPQPPLGSPIVTVSDINPNMLEVGQQRAVRRFSPQLAGLMEWKQADAEALPFADESFDMYTIAFGLRNVTDVDKALGEAYRVLKKGGRFMCLEFSHVDNNMLRQVYDAYSFNVIPKVGEVVAQDRPAYQYLVESIRMFPSQHELKVRMHAQGFRVIAYTNYTFGVVASHSGFKV